MRENKSSYELVKLRDTNIGYISGKTGISKAELKKMLAEAKEKGKYEVILPVGVKVFTRKER